MPTSGVGDGVELSAIYQRLCGVVLLNERGEHAKGEFANNTHH